MTARPVSLWKVACKSALRNAPPIGKGSFKLDTHSSRTCENDPRADWVHSTTPSHREWDFVMHGPDGTDYQEWICWTEIASPERIALLHGESRGDPNAFESVLTFAPDGAATRIEMRTVFPTKELRDEAVEKYHAIEGGQQTLSNLAAYVTEIVRKGVED